MGTLNVNLIADNGGGSNVGVQGEGTATTNLSQGLAKSWFNMSAGATPRDSLNVTSFTDNQTGDDTLTVTSNFSNDDFAAITAGWRDHDAYHATAENSITTSTIQVRSFTRGGNTLVDSGYKACAVHGDLA